MDSVRILFLIDNLRPGGAQKALLSLVRALKTTRAEQAVWCLGGSSRFDFEFEALDVPVLGRPLNTRRLLYEPIELLSYMMRERVSLVQTFLVHSDITARVLGGLARLCTPGRTPIVINSVRATNRNTPLWLRLLQQGTARMATHFTAVSWPSLRFAVEKEGVAADRTTVIPNGIDHRQWTHLPDRREAREALNIPDQAVVVGTVGRLTEQKGQRYLIQAAHKVVSRQPDALFLIAGYGPLEETLKQQAEDAGVAEQVRFLGYRPAVKQLLAAFDLFVLPSLWEGMSNAVLEAMAAGLPVVATRVDGNTEQVADGLTGLLVPPADAESLAEALLDLITDPDRREAMGRRGRERVTSLFPMQRMTSTTLALYERLLEDRAGIPADNWRAQWRTSGA